MFVFKTLACWVRKHKVECLARYKDSDLFAFPESKPRLADLTSHVRNVYAYRIFVRVCSMASDHQNWAYMQFSTPNEVIDSPSFQVHESNDVTRYSIPTLFHVTRN